MWKRLSGPILAVAVLACTPAMALIPPDVTGLWFDPGESGWGLTLADQGQTVFAVLFVYDEAGHPTWYAASSLRPAVDFAAKQATATFSGTLYRTAGPWFGGPFDPHAVSVTPVGTLSIALAGDGSTMDVTYAIDGRTFTKTVRPQTWSDNWALLGGHYEGGLFIFDGAPGTPCPPISFAPANPAAPFDFTITLGQLALHDVHMQWGTGIDTACTLDGVYTQRGQLGSVAGTLACGPIGGPGAAPSNVQLTELAVGQHGFAGAVTLQRGACTYDGHVGGVIKPR